MGSQRVRPNLKKEKKGMPATMWRIDKRVEAWRLVKTWTGVMVVKMEIDSKDFFESSQPQGFMGETREIPQSFNLT